MDNDSAAQQTTNLTVGRQANHLWWGGLSLRDSLVVGFCAASLVLVELFVRLPMHLPGHRVLPLAFFLLLGRACVRSAWSATAIGGLAGLITLALGREDPTHLVKYILSGALEDIASVLLRRVNCSVLLSMSVGGAVGASWLLVSVLTDRLMGMDLNLAGQHSLLKSASAICFGATGGALVPPVARRLRSSGLLPEK